jgi:DUF2075 family protein/predicted GIY-YIG superfamily endonuclease
MTNFEIKSSPFNLGAINTLAQQESKLNDWPVVYTINDQKLIYIGETTSATSRMTNHKASSTKKNLKEVRIILHEKFNKSVCHDLESHLIKYFHADGKYRVMNSNAGMSDYDYFDRDEYRKSFQEIFEELRSQGLMTRSIPDIVNDNIFKYSPFKSLSHDQALAMENVLETLMPSDSVAQENQIVIQGGPGTGKTIVAVYLMKLLTDIANCEPGEELDIDSIFSDFFQAGYREVVEHWRIGLVIPQQSLRKTIQKVFRSIPGLSPKMVLSPFDIGKSTEKWDLLIVDEAHRLKIRSNMSAPTLNTQFGVINDKLFGKGTAEDCSITQLDWVEVQSRNQILLMDSAQSVMPSDLTLKEINSLQERAKDDHKLFTLQTQLRVKGGREYIEYVGAVIDQGDPQPKMTFEDYECGLFDNLGDMISVIKVRESERGLARLAAGFAWKWVTKPRKGKKVEALFDMDINSIKLSWNKAETDWINSPTAIDEVGSIHTIQGYDLNYCGVIIGKDLYLDESDGKIKFSRDSYFDPKGKENNKKCGIVYTDEDLLVYVKQIYRVLLTRGIYGTYIYVCDPALREYFAKYFPSNAQHSS